MSALKDEGEWTKKITIPLTTRFPSGYSPFLHLFDPSLCSFIVHRYQRCQAHDY